MGCNDVDMEINSGHCMDSSRDCTTLDSVECSLVDEESDADADALPWIMDNGRMVVGS